jgi:hypothetical protein
LGKNIDSLHVLLTPALEEPLSALILLKEKTPAVSNELEGLVIQRVRMDPVKKKIILLCQSQMH